MRALVCARNLAKVGREPETPIKLVIDLSKPEGHAQREERIQKRSAPVLEADFRPARSYWLGAVHMMLLGQAVEVATKGLLVAQDPSWVDEGRPQSPFRWRRWGHNIPRLLRETKLELSTNEESVANLLRNFIEWGGRYPSPVNLHTAHPLEWTAADIASAESLYDRLEEARRRLP